MHLQDNTKIGHFETEIKPLPEGGIEISEYFYLPKIDDPEFLKGINEQTGVEFAIWIE